MAVVTLKSTQITNRDAVPAVRSNTVNSYGRKRVTGGMVAAANGDSIGSKYILAQIPSNARITELTLSCTAITSGAADFGLYQTTQAGGVVVAVSAFSAAKSIAAALKNATILRDNTFTPALMEKPIWQVLGLAADPGGFYDIVATLTAATTASGNMGVDVEFVID